MVEEVVAHTGISINISESTPTSVSISQVNGHPVDLLAFLGPTVSRERPLVALLIDLARQTLPA